MAGKKYGNHVVPIPFRLARYFDEKDKFSILSTVDNDISGLNVTLGRNDVIRPFTFGPSPHRPHVHGYDEILLFMGVNPKDITKLGGEVEIAMGREEEKYLFSTPTAVSLPDGLLHCPLTITKVDEPFIFMLVGLKSAGQSFMGKALPRETLKENYGDYIVPMPFREERRGEHVSQLTTTDGDLLGLNCAIGYECFRHPFTSVTEPYTQHVNNFDEALFFIGINTDDPSELGGEVEIALGKEEEKHLINIPTVVSVPRGLPHFPLTVTKVDRPFMLIWVALTPKNVATTMS